MPDNEMFAPLPSAASTGKRKPDGEWVPLSPVPGSAPPPPTGHSTRGKPAALWTYRNATGEMLGQIWRFNDDAGAKTILPLTFCQHSDNGKYEWRWKGFADPRPLYGLDRLAARLDAPVLVVEGEKSADACQKLLPDFVAVTSPNGSKSAGKANWNPLHRRRVVIWPDNDEPGRDYAETVARLVNVQQAESIRVITPPPGVSDGWDAADALAEKWTTAKAQELVQSAQPWTAPASVAEKEDSEGAENSSRGRKPSQRDEVLALIDDLELWHSPDRQAYASITISGHVENWSVRSRDFKIWLSGEAYSKTGRAPGSQMLEDALRVMEARAIHQGNQYTTFLRVGYIDDNVYFLDLGRPDWKAVKITQHKWEVVDSPDVKFIRSPAMQALPIPESAENLEDLRQLTNLRTENDFHLIVSWLVSALRPKGPYPILVVNGEQGSSKSTMSRLLRMLVDPNVAPIRACPKDGRDLVSMARNSWMVVLDNISEIPGWLSDGLCQIASGAGFSSRELYSDQGESIFSGWRPIILNGIPDFANRSDLASRAILINLPAIPDNKRRAESDFWTDVIKRLPLILGALLDGVSGAMRRLETIKLDTMSRMADFDRWATAAEYPLGWEDGHFMDASRANVKASVEASIEADPVLEAIRKLVHDRDFEGTATGLLTALEEYVDSKVHSSRYWPTPVTLKKRLQRGQGPMRQDGIIMEFDKRATTSDRSRLISIRMPIRKPEAS